MTSLVGGAIAGSLLTSVYEKVDHHLYNKVNDKVGFELFEVEEENKDKNNKIVPQIKKKKVMKMIFVFYMLYQYCQ